MTARDRAKMERRLARAWRRGPGLRLSNEEIAIFTVREVDRAVRAERAAFRATEELRAAQAKRTTNSFEYARRNHP